MTSSDFSSDLGLGNLAPASSVRRIETEAPGHDADRESRRRRRPEIAPEPEEDAPDQELGEKVHQLDHLA